MRFQLIGAGFAAGGMALVFVVAMVDRSMNYQTVPGRIDHVEAICYLDQKVGKTTTTTDKYPCDEMEDAQANHPQYKGFRLNRETTIDVTYVSPVDQQEHSGKLYDTTHEKEAPFKGKGEGEMIDILAHTSNPEKIQKLF